MDQRKNSSWYKDWRFWLLLLVINMSGNPCLDAILSYKGLLVLTFAVLCLYAAARKINITRKGYIFLSVWFVILLVPQYYTSHCPLSSTFHVMIKICVGVFTLLLLKEKFIKYYSDIIYAFCIISLICLLYNHLVGVLPYVKVSEGMDGGRNHRVSSIVYTQLYNLQAGGGQVFRNCGPFWEPGAFQGFINLAFMLELLTAPKRNKAWFARIAVFSVSILTTYSSGGYVVLFLNILYLIHTTRTISAAGKLALTGGFFALASLLFVTADFLYAKISADASSDKGRLGVNISDLFPNSPMLVLFGYGFSAESLSRSTLHTVGSVFNLLRYTGIAGLLAYWIPLIGIPLSINRLYFACVSVLIMMNEPFITAGPFWWGVPLLYTYIDSYKRKTTARYEYIQAR